MKKIIAFCGRKESGKTELSKICMKHGYERIYFAQPLKDMCSIIFGKTVDELNLLKKVNLNWVMTDTQIRLFSELSGIPLEFSFEKLYEHVFHNTRDIFQYIGTDVIRSYENDWHVEKTNELIEDSKSDFVCVDDVRFPNELAMLRELNADIWFITRPKIDNISNHASETSIRWQDIEHIIENNIELDKLTEYWDAFVEYHDKMTEYRDIVYRECNRYVGCGDGDKQIISTLLKDDLLRVFYPISKFSYSDKFVNNTNIDKITDCSDESKRQVLVTYKDGSEEIIDNTLMIEDLKFYL